MFIMFFPFKIYLKKSFCSKTYLIYDPVINIQVGFQFVNILFSVLRFIIFVHVVFILFYLEIDFFTLDL